MTDPGYPEQIVSSIFSLEASIGAGKSSLLEALKREICARGLSAFADENTTDVTTVPRHPHRFLVVEEPVDSWTQTRYSTALANGQAPPLFPKRALMAAKVVPGVAIALWFLSTMIGDITRMYFATPSTDVYLAIISLLVDVFLVMLVIGIGMLFGPLVGYMATEWYTPDLSRSLLDIFYGDMTRFAFVFQIKAFTSRLKLIHEQCARLAKHLFLPNLLDHGPVVRYHVITERSLPTDRLFLRNLYEGNHVMRVELAVYEEIFDFFTRSIVQRLKTMIYLPTAPQRCLERIRRRGRACERDIGLAYLESLDVAHKSMVEKFGREPGHRVIRAERMVDELSQTEVDAYARELLEQMLERCRELS